MQCADNQNSHAGCRVKASFHPRGFAMGPWHHFQLDRKILTNTGLREPNEKQMARKEDSRLDMQFTRQPNQMPQKLRCYCGARLMDEIFEQCQENVWWPCRCDGLILEGKNSKERPCSGCKLIASIGCGVGISASWVGRATGKCVRRILYWPASASLGTVLVFLVVCAL